MQKVMTIFSARKQRADKQGEKCSTICAPKRTHRGKGRGKDKSLSIYYVNINGFKKRSISLESIILQLKNPDIIILCEIKHVTANFIRLFFKKLGYETIVKKAGGLVLAAKGKFDMVDATSTPHHGLIVGSLRLGETYVDVIASYGPQESDEQEKRETFYNELQIEVESSINRGNMHTIVGDLNAKISHNENGISKESPNGQLLLDTINKFQMKVLNFDKKCQGKWTRVQDHLGETRRSVLDYIITDEKLGSFFAEMIIDEEKVMAPFWLKNTKTGTIRKHSDHNSIHVTFRVPYAMDENRSTNKPTNLGWKITSDGLVKFKEVTDAMNIMSDEDIMNLGTHLDSIMDNCFSKRVPKKFSHPNVNKENLITAKRLSPLLKVIIEYTRKGKNERIAARVYVTLLQNIQSEWVQSQKSTRISQVINDISDENGKLSVDKFYKLKKSLSCSDNSRSSITTSSGTEIFGGPAMVKEYENEFVSRLSHRKINESFVSYEETTKRLFDLCLSVAENSQSEPDFSVSEVEKAMRNMKADSSAGPNHRPPKLYLNAGKGLITNITKLFNFIKRKTTFPNEWFDLIIVTIYKNKGSRKKLKYYRGIFLANIITKIFERVIKKRITSNLRGVNLLQAGSTENRSTCDDIFLINGLIDHARYLKTPLYLTFYDYSTCFDSLWLEDCMISLWDLGIRNELFALIFKMNELANIKVKTPFGMSAPFVCNRIVKQGTVLSSNLCSASTGELCDSNYKGGASVGTTTISDILYVDDTTDPNTNIVDTIESHDEVVNFSMSKRLSLNQEKCVLLTVNKKSTDVKPTLVIGDETVENVTKCKVLGDIVNERGNKIDLINDRVSKGKASIVTCLGMCNEVTMGAFFLKTAITLYDSVFLKVMLFNCAGWTNLTESDLKNLRTVQLKYLKRLAHAPHSTPNAFVFLEFGVLPVEFIIHIRQLSFLHHVTDLRASDPVYSMFEQQQQLPFEKNWANNTHKLLEKYNIDFPAACTVSKMKWKDEVKKIVRGFAFRELKNQISTQSKTKHLQYTEFKQQSYLTHYTQKQASTIFKIRSRSTECKNNRKSSTQDLACRFCSSTAETQEHIVNCHKIVEDGSCVDLQCIMQEEVPPSCDEVTEVVSRFRKFSKMVNNSSTESNACTGES